MATNRRAQHCERCGILVEAGKGQLEFVPDAHDNDDFDRVGTPQEAAHWEVHCLDQAACLARAQATKDRHEAEAAARRIERTQEQAAAQAVREAKRAAWSREIAGLAKTEAAPAEYSTTQESFDNGDDVRCQKIILAGGAKGWLVSWIGDMDGHYFLLPQESKQIAEAEEARLHRVYQWWRPQGYGADSYPGPGVPEDQLTEDERAEVAIRFAAKYAAAEAKERRCAEISIVGLPGGQSKGCEVYQQLRAIPGAEISLDLGDEFGAFCRGRADYPLYSAERDALQLVATLHVKLPLDCFTKNGKLKAAIERRIPDAGPHKTSARSVTVNVEVAGLSCDS